ncbi:glycerate kinase, partial [Gemmiger formicilis]|uniref:glycerate kinase n=1 Tax=Gemmiger formicilis TaxID=745368 RepID=UPI00195C821B
IPYFCHRQSSPLPVFGSLLPRIPQAEHLLRRGGKVLAGLCTITTDQVMPELAECEFKVACDVTNPLCGAQGS